ncbi:prolipoprotein diacylglyceryl transferase [archaeon]|jgi:phosphatidylglycerol---prolipoprotein diacylglyceryl transferase|nr:prolipoprotein diacylglyceryl transferase [archaeon]MBT6697912.1 prolipoprotein diacylglyceryl transferase [archaeon]
MWIHNLDPILFSLGPVSIRWYGLAYLFGALFGLWWLLFLQRKGELPDFSSDDCWDLVLYLLVGILAGSRLFMIFWQPSVYFGDPLEIFRVWHGGMSFHGGLFGIIVAGLLFARKKKGANFFVLADVAAFPMLLALGVGRLANFVNGELVGRIFDGPWCVVFPSYDESCRHPWAVYAALRRFVFAFGLFGLSYFQYFRNFGFKPGFIFWNFVFWDGLGRFVLDFWRVDPLTLGLTLGQWFSLVMVVIGGWFLLLRHKEDWKKLINGFFKTKTS